MSDDIKGFAVILDHDVNEHYAKNIINAISMIKGVSNVKSHIAEGNDYIIETRTLQKLEEKIFKIFRETR